MNARNFSAPEDILTDMFNELTEKNRDQKPIYLSTTGKIRNDTFTKMVDKIHTEEKNRLFLKTFELATDHSFVIQIGDLMDQTFVKAVRKYAEREKIDEVLILNEADLKEVLKLGIEKFRELYGEKEIAKTIINFK